MEEKLQTKQLAIMAEKALKKLEDQLNCSRSGYNSRGEKSTVILHTLDSKDLIH